MKVGEVQRAPDEHRLDASANQQLDGQRHAPSTSRHTRPEHRVPFTEIGRLTERETKHGTNYLAGEILGVPVYIFPREDGSWRIFTPTHPHTTVQPAGASEDGAKAEPMTEYTHTLDDVAIPDPGEPIRHRTVPQEPELAIQKDSTHPRQPKNRPGAPRKGNHQ